jgi:putative membrane protein
VFWPDGFSLAGWWGMGVGTVLFWALVALFVVLVVRATAGSRTTPPGASSRGDEARRILDERFARGEITEEEYLHRREVLGG